MSHDDTLPPLDIGAEMCALASLCLCGEDRVRFRQIRRLLWREAFVETDNQILFRTLCEMDDAGKSIDAVTLRAELQTRGLFEEIGGRRYLAAILNSVPSHLHGAQYASIVAERARERDAGQICLELHRKLYQPHRQESAADVLQRYIERLWSIVTSGRDLKIWKLAEPSHLRAASLIWTASMAGC
jgi:replicative DNA helicase